MLTTTEEEEEEGQQKAQRIHAINAIIIPSPSEQGTVTFVSLLGRSIVLAGLCQWGNLVGLWLERGLRLRWLLAYCLIMVCGRAI